MKLALLKDIYPKRPKLKETVMFVFACLILISVMVPSLIFIGNTIGEIASPALEPYASEEAALPGAEILVGFAIIAAIYIFAPIGFLLCAVFLAFWALGLVLSAKLVLRIRLIPMWMHIASIVLVLCYLALLTIFLLHL